MRKLLLLVPVMVVITRCVFYVNVLPNFYKNFLSYNIRLKNTFWIEDEEDCSVKAGPFEILKSDCLLENGNLWFTNKEVHYVIYPPAEEDIDDYFCFFGDDINNGKAKVSYKIKNNTIYSKCTRRGEIKKLKTKIVKLKGNKLVLRIDGENKSFTKHNGWRILKWRY